jgi:hypothetical protein
MTEIEQRVIQIGGSAIGAGAACCSSTSPIAPTPLAILGSMNTPDESVIVSRYGRRVVEWPLQRLTEVLTQLQRERHQMKMSTGTLRPKLPPLGSRSVAGENSARLANLPHTRFIQQRGGQRGKGYGDDTI